MAPAFDDLWSFDDPVATRERFIALLPSTEGEKRAELLSQIARTHSLVGEFDQAHEILDEAISEAPFDSVAEIRVMLERGRTLNSSGAIHSALTFFLQAFEKAKALQEDYFAIDAAHMVAIVEKGKESNRWNERGLEIARKSTDESARKWDASLLNNMAWVAFDDGDFNTALDLHQQARELRECYGQDRREQIARWSIARVLREMGRKEEALAIQEQLAIEAPDDPFVQEELGLLRS